MKRALITGVAGQDGSYLAEFLFDKGYEVHGIARSSSTITQVLRERLKSVSVIDLAKPQSLKKVIREIRPDEVYHLAAHHFSSQGTQNRTGELDPFISINLMAANVMLEVMRYKLPESRFFYAASAHIFGAPTVSPQTESTPLLPDTPYAISKSAGVHLCRYFREKHNVYASTGILYNHESPRRPSSFVTTQIARCATLAYVGKPEPIIIRDLDAVVDWGAAQDYVRAMWLTLQQSLGDDYIIASGVPRTVRDFAEAAFECVNLNADDFVFQDQKKVEDKRLPYIGDSSKVRQMCEWEPCISFHELVKEMVDYQLYCLKAAST